MRQLFYSAILTDSINHEPETFLYRSWGDRGKICATGTVRYGVLAPTLKAVRRTGRSCCHIGGTLCSLCGWLCELLRTRCVSQTQNAPKLRPGHRWESLWGFPRPEDIPSSLSHPLASRFWHLNWQHRHFVFVFYKLSTGEYGETEGYGAIESAGVL